MESTNKHAKEQITIHIDRYQEYGFRITTITHNRLYKAKVENWQELNNKLQEITYELLVDC